MLRLRWPTLTASEKSALLALVGILGSGAALHAWERSGLKLGPAHDWESLHRLVVQSRHEAGDTAAFPCLEPPPEFGEHWPNRTQDPEPKTPGRHASHKKEAPTSILDLNQADAEALQRLPGIGPGTAKAIVASRASEGRFGQVEDLLRVKGIGDKKLAALLPFVTVAKEEKTGPRDAVSEPREIVKKVVEP